jgi:hypothetical protein
MTLLTDPHRPPGAIIKSDTRPSTANAPSQTRAELPSLIWAKGTLTSELSRINPGVLNSPYYKTHLLCCRDSPFRTRPLNAPNPHIFLLTSKSLSMPMLDQLRFSLPVFWSFLVMRFNVVHE